MKKWVLLLIFFLIPLVLALQVDIKEKYNPGQTILVKLEGNFLQTLSSEQIQFYSGRSFIPLVYDSGKIEEKYYIYAILPPTQRNYTLVIENIKYLELGNEKTEDLKYNFSVSGNISDFSVNPGFIITNKDFYITLESNIKSVNVKSEFLNSTKQIEIPPIQKNKVKYSISDIKKSTVEEIKMYTNQTEYNVPVSIFKTNIENQTFKNNLQFSDSELNFTILEDIEFEFQFSLFNSGQENIENISITPSSELEKTINISPDYIPAISGGNYKKIKLFVESNKDKSGFLNIIYENETSQIKVNIFVREQDEINQSVISQISGNNDCSSLGGQFCEDKEECLGKTKYASDGDGICCIGECKEKSGFGIGKIISLFVIFIILAIIIFFIIKKVRQKQESSDKVLKKKSEDYEKRFKSQETRGNLSRH